MGIRFRKRIKILPGFSLNISKRGIRSASIGGKGLTVNVAAKKGAKVTASIPGTGISHSTSLGSRAKGQGEKNGQKSPESGVSGFVFALFLITFLSWLML